jgi:hypothetical protein
LLTIVTVRRTIAFLTALAAGLTVTPPAHAADGDDATVAEGEVWTTDPGMTSAALRDMVGVGVHLAYGDTPYADTDKVAAALNDLGIRHLRDDLFLDNQAQYAAMQRVHALTGARFDLIMGRPGNGRTAGEYVATAAALGSVVEAFEGPNEWDINGNLSTWADDLRTYQADLFGAVKGNAATAGVPVLAPALAFRSNYATLGDLQGTSDVANAHVYPGGEKPTTGLDDALATVRARTGVANAVVSETGYHDANASQSTHPGVPQDVAAIYTPRLLLEHALRGVRRTYLYELVDEFADPDGTNDEASFGLLHRDWTPKPAYTALRNLLTLVGDPGPQDASPLQYRLSGGAGDVQHLLVDRADGSHVLFLWRDVSAYSTSLKARTNAGAVPVTLTVPGATVLSTYRPSESAAASRSAAGTSVTLDVDASTTAVVIGGGQVGVSTPTPPRVVVTEPNTSVQTDAPTRVIPATLKPPSVVKVVPGLRAIVMRLQVGRRQSEHLDKISVSVAGGHTVRVGPDQRVVRLTGLVPGRRYRVSVRSWAEGRASRPAQVTTTTRSH